ncbi:DUF3152 domain-containing protein [Streptomyces sp. NPDC101181]|uniref:DUF3152 domain-containing protein n=1 Tax=Streptomyces sp. NPDC101181 TaxID=3366125 RepID=UPI00382CAEC4
MGRHSRKGSEAIRPDAATAAPGGERVTSRTASGSGRRRRSGPVAGDGRSPFSSFSSAAQVRGGHPEQREPGGGWGSRPTGSPSRPDDDGDGFPDPRSRSGDGHESASSSSRRGGGGGHGSPADADGRAPRQHPAHPYATDADGPLDQDVAAARLRAVARQVSAQRAAQQAAEDRASRPSPAGPPVPGPRREFIDAFDEEPPDSGGATSAAAGGDGDAGEPDEDSAPRGGRGRTATGIAAAAVTTVLAIVVAGQVAEDSGVRSAAARAAGVERQGAGEEASRSDARPTPGRPPVRPEVKPLSYAHKMAKPFPLAPDLKASGVFEAVPGLAKAPGKGQKHRYRIDVEEGLGLDAGLFAEAVQKTLNDDRSWAHNGAMTFERISSGRPDFVITLASPGTTGEWCAKSGLDTTVDNVSCDSASTDRVMINAYRWAQGAATFGPDKMLSYRQMLINHEVGHRLGHNHVSCRTPGVLAPVMQQQTKTLELEGIKCRPNPWVHPGG